MRYLPHSDEEIAAMLKACGLGSLDELFTSVPAAERMKRPLDIEPALDEPALMRHVRELCDKNRAANPRTKAAPFVGLELAEQDLPKQQELLVINDQRCVATDQAV